MGVGMCLYAQLVQMKNTQCKSAIIIQGYHPYLSGFCFRPRLTQPYNHIIYPGVAKIYLVLWLMWLIDYADFLRIGYMKNKLKIIYCVSRSFNKAYRRDI